MSEYRQRLLAAADDGALILTANKRLARHLREHFDHRKQQAGVGAWRSPLIMSLESWLRVCLERAILSGNLLEPLVAQRLWERTIAELEELPSDRTALRRIARVAMEAHQLLEHYDAVVEGWPLSPDQEAFLRWRDRYRQRLAEGGWLDSSSAARRVAQLIRQGAIPLPERLVLAGFDDMTPRVRSLITELRGRAVQVEETPPPLAPGGSAVRVRVDGDRLSEVRLAARWVRDLLEKGEENIGIVVPDLRLYRKDIERILREELDPQSLVQLRNEGSRFSLSLGAPLGSHPPVRAALEILSIQDRIDLDHAGYLLRSPFLKGAETERYMRSRCDARLRRRGRPEIRLATLLHAVESSGEGPRAPIFASLLRKLAGLVRERSARRPGLWSEHFLECLAAAGWPGERSLASSEYQVCQAARDKLFGGLVAFDRIVGEVTREEALGLLQQLAGELEFQPDAPAGPVQVVGFLEAGGLSFRHLWILGLTAEVFPAAARPSPLLPSPLQVRHGMPHASAERELDFARRILDRSLAAAPEVIFSYPARDGDADLLPSPLVLAYPEVAAFELPESRRPATAWLGQLPLERYTPGLAPELSQGTRVKGGVGVLRDQAHCPFRAFARHRLGARSLETPEPGIDSATRGSLLHHVLELLWQRLGDSLTLQATPKDALQRLIGECVEAALGACSATLGEEAPLLRELEEERLRQLLFTWLTEVESQRRPFVVEQTEILQELEQGGLLLEGRVDRIDRLEDGARLLIDYKSGRLPSRSAFEGDPLLEPQLPAYAVAAQSPPAGVLLASLRRDELGWLGIGREGSLPVAAMETSPADWEARLARWRKQVEELAVAFRQGRADVAPAEGGKICSNCDLPSFCRVGELGLGAEAGEDA